MESTQVVLTRALQTERLLLWFTISSPLLWFLLLLTMKHTEYHRATFSSEDVLGWSIPSRSTITILRQWAVESDWVTSFLSLSVLLPFHELLMLQKTLLKNINRRKFLIIIQRSLFEINLQHLIQKAALSYPRLQLMNFHQSLAQSEAPCKMLLYFTSV